MNSSLQDAHNLAWKLAAVLRHGASVSLLDSFEAERKPVAWRNADRSVANWRGALKIPAALGMPFPVAEAVAWYVEGVWKESEL